MQNQPQTVRPPREVGVAYILLLIAGVWGAHRYYTGRKTSAIWMTAISATLVGLMVTSVWVLVDLFLTARFVDEYNNPSRVYADSHSWSVKGARRHEATT